MTSLQKLGYPAETKLLIVHADDAGLSHAENRATIQALEYGVVTSYSVMVPCPWFYEMAGFARDNPQFDCGVHLTLTCEWETYKFGPVLPTKEVPSLVDGNGHFYRKREQLKANAIPSELEKELDAQIQLALKLGLRPTHLDSHMYSVGADPAFFEVYRNLGKRYNLPVLISRDLLQFVGLDPEKVIDTSDFVVDKTYVADFQHFLHDGLEAYYDSVLESLTSGVNLILIHPAFDDEEMKGVTVNHPNFGSAWRQQDVDFFTKAATREKLSASKIELTTWRDLELRRKIYDPTCRAD